MSSGSVGAHSRRRRLSPYSKIFRGSLPSTGPLGKLGRGINSSAGPIRAHSAPESGKVVNSQTPGHTASRHDVVGPDPPEQCDKDVSSQKITTHDVGIVDSSPTSADGSSNEPYRLDQYEDFWRLYDREAGMEDELLVKGLAADLDNVLLFASIFSAIQTPFIIESYKDLQQDQSKITNDLLRLLIQTVDQSSTGISHPSEQSFVVSSRAIRVNVLFVTGLALSLTTAFIAATFKQLIYQYASRRKTDSLVTSGTDRQRRFDGLQQYHFRYVVATLPTILQIALAVFLIGLSDFIVPINQTVATVLIFLSANVLCQWITLSIIGTLFPDSPFQTELSLSIRSQLVRVYRAQLLLFDIYDWGSRGNGLPQLRRLREKLEKITRRLLPRPDDDERKRKRQVLMAKCVDWLRERKALGDYRWMVAKAAMLLNEETRNAVKLDYAALLGYMMQSSIHDGLVYIGTTTTAIQSSLTLLRIMVAKWDKKTELDHDEDAENVAFLQQLKKRLWSLVLEPEQEEKSAAIILDTIDMLGPSGISDPHHAAYLVGFLGTETLHYSSRLHCLNLLHDAIRSNDSLDVETHNAAAHITAVLAKTIWRPDGRPDVDARRVGLRLSWFLNNLDTMYPSVRDAHFSRYLSEWRDNAMQQDTSGSLSPSALARLYLKVLIALLTLDPEKWGKELDRFAHMAYIWAICQNSTDPYEHLLCWTSFLLLRNAAGLSQLEHSLRSRYYPEEWVQFVDRIVAEDIDMSKITQEILYSPTDVIVLMKALHKYLQVAQQYGSTALHKVNATPGLAKFGDRMGLPSWSEEMKVAWASEIQPLFVTWRDAAAESGTPEPRLRNDFDTAKDGGSGVGGSGVNGLRIKEVEAIREGKRLASRGDVEMILQLLRDSNITREAQLGRLDQLCTVFSGLAYEVVDGMLKDIPSSNPITNGLLSTMWVYEEDPKALASDIRQQTVDSSGPRLELRRTWLEHCSQEVHTEFERTQFSLYLSAWHDTNPAQSEQYLKAVATLLGRFPNTWLSTLKHDGHIERIAHLMESSAIQGVPRQKVRVIQWMSFKLFLAMWHHKSEETNDPYLTDRCRERLISFLSSITPHPPTDDIHASIEAEDAFPVVMTARDFVAAGCTYLEALAATRPLSEGEGTVIAAFERFTHPSLCRATRMADEQDWNQEINDYIARVADLRNESRNSD